MMEIPHLVANQRSGELIQKLAARGEMRMA
jgi:hypothetical protein